MLVAGTDLRLKGNTPKASEPDRKRTPHISLCIHQQMEYISLWVMWAI